MSAPGSDLVHVTAILGRLGVSPFVDRQIDTVMVTAGDAVKRRLRRTSTAGVGLAIDLPRGSFLADGAVLVDLGQAVIAVEREPEEVVLVRLDPGLPSQALVEAAARIGHAFGNQHVPIEVAAGEILVPITTSADLALATIEALGLRGVAVTTGLAKLARDRPLPTGHAHAAGAAASIELGTGPR